MSDKTTDRTETDQHRKSDRSDHADADRMIDEALGGRLEAWQQFARRLGIGDWRHDPAE